MKSGSTNSIKEKSIYTYTHTRHIYMKYVILHTYEVCYTSYIWSICNVYDFVE